MNTVIMQFPINNEEYPLFLLESSKDLINYQSHKSLILSPLE